jgi:hypothetical protein
VPTARSGLLSRPACRARPVFTGTATPSKIT